MKTRYCVSCFGKLRYSPTSADGRVVGCSGELIPNSGIAQRFPDSNYRRDEGRPTTFGGGFVKAGSGDEFAAGRDRGPAFRATLLKEPVALAGGDELLHGLAVSGDGLERSAGTTGST